MAGYPLIRQRKGSGYLKMLNKKLYNSWRGMKARCNNINNYDYKYYGVWE